MAVVVLLDDDPFVRDMAKEMLASAGHEVRPFGFASEAMEYMSTGPTDVLVTDIKLRGPIDGWAVAEAARRRSPEIPVIYITGYYDPREGERMVDGARLLRKPFFMKQLESAFDEVTAGRQSSQG